MVDRPALYVCKAYCDKFERLFGSTLSVSTFNKRVLTPC